MDKKRLEELSTRAIDKVGQAVAAGDTEAALSLMPALEREDISMHRLLAQVIYKFLVPLIEEKFVEREKSLTAQIAAAIKAGNKKEAVALLDTKAKTWLTIHDIYEDFLLDCFGYIYDSFGKETLFEFFRKWGEGTRPWFEKRASMTPEESLEAAAMVWKEHMGSTRIVEDKDKYRLVLEPCGSGGKLLERIEQGRSGKKGVSTRIPTKEPLLGDNSNLLVYCAHCPFLFETLAQEWTGKPMWVLTPPQKAGDPCMVDVYKDPSKAPARGKQGKK